MPKNKTGGKKHKKSANKDDEKSTRFLELKGTDEDYAEVTKMLGNRRLLAVDQQGRQRLCIIPGKLKGKKRGAWVSAGDYVLLGIRSYQDTKADVLHLYNAHEVKELTKMGHITKIDNVQACDPEEIVFTEESGAESEQSSEEVLQQPIVPEYPSVDSDIDIDDL